MGNDAEHRRWTPGGATQDEKQAVKDYTGLRSETINKALREKAPLAEQDQETLMQLDALLDRSKVPEKA